MRPVYEHRWSEVLYLDVEVEGEERWDSIVLQHPVVTLALEAVLGEMLRADAAVLCGLKVVPHRCHPFTTNIWTSQREPGEIH